ncbi:MAG TPA: hypothetical protein PKJ41_19140 [Bryobacteraceae bacterium]|nr:hypothetical protein [Bryobacteraceae bacterium]HPT28174.1 hypothetical protein [Bryobacteraceae bacterium]
MKWTRAVSLLHLLAAPAYAATLWNYSAPIASLIAATLLGSAVLLWQGNRWVVIYSGLLAILSLGFLFFLAFSVQGGIVEHMAPAVLGSIAYLAIHAAAVFSEWVSAKAGPEITVEPD